MKKEHKYLINYTVEITENEHVLIPVKRLENCELAFIASLILFKYGDLDEIIEKLNKELGNYNEKI